MPRRYSSIRHAIRAMRVQCPTRQRVNASSWVPLELSITAGEQRAWQAETTFPSIASGTIIGLERRGVCSSSVGRRYTPSHLWTRRRPSPVSLPVVQSIFKSKKCIQNCQEGVNIYIRRAPPRLSSKPATATFCFGFIFVMEPKSGGRRTASPDSIWQDFTLTTACCNAHVPLTKSVREGERKSCWRDFTDEKGDRRAAAEPEDLCTQLDRLVLYLRNARCVPFAILLWCIELASTVMSFV